MSKFSLPLVLALFMSSYSYACDDFDIQLVKKLNGKTVSSALAALGAHYDSEYLYSWKTSSTSVSFVHTSPNSEEKSCRQNPYIDKSPLSDDEIGVSCDDCSEFNELSESYCDEQLEFNECYFSDDSSDHFQLNESCCSCDDFSELDNEDEISALRSCVQKLNPIQEKINKKHRRERDLLKKRLKRLRHKGYTGKDGYVKSDALETEGFREYLK